MAWASDRRASASGRRRDGDRSGVQACASALDDPAFAATVEHYRGQPLPMLTEPMLHPGDVAVLLGIPVKTVTQYAREERLPHYRVGRNVRFLRGEVERAVLAGRLSHVS
ncbi:MAG TPA: helix-turn-helix domain-containing protein [Solirubrobacteraceae bacterium]